MSFLYYNHLYYVSRCSTLSVETRPTGRWSLCRSMISHVISSPHSGLSHFYVTRTKNFEDHAHSFQSTVHKNGSPVLKSSMIYIHYLQVYRPPTYRPVPSWPDSSTGGALPRLGRGQGLRPFVELLSTKNCVNHTL